jgi:hypothetical protein
MSPNRALISHIRDNRSDSGQHHRHIGGKTKKEFPLRLVHWLSARASSSFQFFELLLAHPSMSGSVLPIRARIASNGLAQTPKQDNVYVDYDDLSALMERLRI